MDLKDRQVIMHEIAMKEKAIIDMKAERRQAYLKVKDFGSVDSVATDKAVHHMKFIDKEIDLLERAIKSRRKKISLASKGYEYK